MTSTTVGLKQAQPKATAKSDDRRDVGILMLMNVVPYAAAIAIALIISVA
jgi:hypothetical protein